MTAYNQLVHNWGEISNLSNVCYLMASNQTTNLPAEKNQAHCHRRFMSLPSSRLVRALCAYSLPLSSTIDAIKRTYTSRKIRLTTIITIYPKPSPTLFFDTSDPTIGSTFTSCGCHFQRIRTSNHPYFYSLSSFQLSTHFNPTVYPRTCEWLNFLIDQSTSQPHEHTYPAPGDVLS